MDGRVQDASELRFNIGSSDQGTKLESTQPGKRVTIRRKGTICSHEYPRTSKWNCQDPVRCVGSWVLVPNRTSGIHGLQWFSRKPANRPNCGGREGLQPHRPQVHRPTTGAAFALKASISLTNATRRASDKRLNSGS